MKPKDENVVIEAIKELESNKRKSTQEWRICFIFVSISSVKRGNNSIVAER